MICNRPYIFAKTDFLQLRDRDWISVIEVICANGYLLLSLYVIFKNKVVVVSWFDDLPKN